MQAIRAIYDGVGFKPKQPIPVKENYEVIITFLEPLPNTDKTPRKHIPLSERLKDWDGKRYELQPEDDAWISMDSVGEEFPL